MIYDSIIKIYCEKLINGLFPIIKISCLFNISCSVNLTPLTKVPFVELESEI